MENPIEMHDVGVAPFIEILMCEHILILLNSTVPTSLSKELAKTRWVLLWILIDCIF